MEAPIEADADTRRVIGTFRAQDEIVVRFVVSAVLGYPDLSSAAPAV